MGISFLTSPLSCLQQLDKMRGFIVALALISACAAVSRDAQWEEFKLTFKKGYRNLDQESERKGIFMAHLDAIEAHNAKFEAGLSTYKQGINQFSDLTFEEFENTVLMREQSYVQGETKPLFHEHQNSTLILMIGGTKMFWELSKIKDNAEVAGPLEP